MVILATFSDSQLNAVLLIGLGTIIGFFAIAAMLIAQRRQERERQEELMRRKSTMP